MLMNFNLYNHWCYLLEFYIIPAMSYKHYLLHHQITTTYYNLRDIPHNRQVPDRMSRTSLIVSLLFECCLKFCPGIEI